MAKFSDVLREEKEKQKQEDNTRKLAHDFNDAASKLIRQFLADVETGQIVIDDTADLTRLMNIYLQVNDLENAVDGVGGQLPGLSKRQSSTLDEEIEIEEVEDEDTGETNRYVDTESMESLDGDDIMDLINKRGASLNKDNEEANL